MSTLEDFLVFLSHNSNEALFAWITASNSPSLSHANPKQTLKFNYKYQ